MFYSISSENCDFREFTNEGINQNIKYNKQGLQNCKLLHINTFKTPSVNHKCLYMGKFISAEKHFRSTGCPTNLWTITFDALNS